jgi:asparagine synthase (glutamine-hydrolysing)
MNSGGRGGDRSPVPERPAPRFPPLEPLEIATEYVVGRRVAAPLTMPAVDMAATPRSALRRAILPALQRPPCLVSFSGGRDSSAVLALAAHTARAEGLELPIPMTLRFPAAPRTNESGWQELVVRHLDLPHWERRDLGDDVEILGPWATKLLAHIGLYWPRNLHFLMPIVAAAQGGAVLTGVGGDETFQHFPTRGEIGRAILRRPSLRALRELGPSLPPAVIRRQVLRRYRRWHLPWLVPAARAELAARWSKLNEAPVARFQDALDEFLASRYHELASSLPLVGAWAGVEVVSPFLDLEFHATLARDLPATGFASRTAAMTELFGDLLPQELLSRPTKAFFTEALWGAASRDFTLRWDGTGLDGDVVDRAGLEAQWSRPVPNWRTWGLVHQAWLASGPLTRRPGSPADRLPRRGSTSAEAWTGCTSADR